MPHRKSAAFRINTQVGNSSSIISQEDLCLDRKFGEVEYCQGVAAQCESGIYGMTRVCAGICGTANFQDPKVVGLVRPVWVVPGAMS